MPPAVEPTVERAVRLQLTSGQANAVRDQLIATLAGGPPFAPLPEADLERAQALETLRPNEPVPESDAAVVLVTSGSTGRPKGVVLSRAAVVAAAGAVHARLGGPGDWVLALPAHYVAGFGVIARGVVAGTQVHPAQRDLSDLDRSVAAATGRCYVSLVPTQLHRACADPRQAEALAACAGVLIGGAAADPELLDRAGDLGIPVVTTYGMSETGGGCVYDGVPLDGVTAALDDDGRIRLGGPTLFSGYRLDPGRTAAVLADGWFRTDDRGRWDTGRLAVTGRVDDVVTVGGHNVDLALVERLVRAALGEAAVVAVPDREWGSQLVVAAPTGDLPTLQTALGSALPPHAWPRRLLRTALPHTAGGKIDRDRLRRLALERSA